MSARALGAALAAILVSAQPAVAAAEVRPCVSEADAENLAVVLLPPLVTAVAVKCRPLLPASAFLSRSAASLAAGYRPAADAAWPRARATAERLGSDQLSGFLSEDIERAVVEQLVSAAIVAQIAPSDCGTISDFAEAAAPLPPRNIGRLIALVLRTKLASGMPFGICTAGETR